MSVKLLQSDRIMTSRDVVFERSGNSVKFSESDSVSRFSFGICCYKSNKRIRDHVICIRYKGLSTELDYIFHIFHIFKFYGGSI